MTKHIIEVYTQQDCNDLCAVLSRSGYCTIAYFIPSAVTNSLISKQWRIEYYDPKEAEGVAE